MSAPCPAIILLYIMGHYACIYITMILIWNTDVCVCGRVCVFVCVCYKTEGSMSAPRPATISSASLPAISEGREGGRGGEGEGASGFEGARVRHYNRSASVGRGKEYVTRRAGFRV